MPRYNKKRKEAVDALVKEDICKAVSRILAEGKPQALTMELVAQEAGMAKGTLYNYFKNKAELIAYVVLSYGRPYEEESEQIATASMPVPEKLLKIAELNMAVASEHGEALAMMAESASQSFAQSFSEDMAAESRNTGEKRIMKVIQEGLNKRVFKDIPVDDLVTAYCGIVELFARRRQSQKKNRTVEKDAKMAMQIFMDGAGA